MTYMTIFEEYNNGIMSLFRMCVDFFHFTWLVYMELNGVIMGDSM